MKVRTCLRLVGVVAVLVGMCGVATSRAEETLPASTGQKLRSPEPSQIKAGLDDARLAGRAATSVVPDINALLERGLTTGLAEAALDTLADIATAAAGDVTTAKTGLFDTTSATIAPYAQHRNVRVRQAAIKALLHTKGPTAIKAVRHALSDSDATVRRVAASGLGSMKAREAVPDLLIALEHRVGDAAVSIGQLCDPLECDNFVGHLGRQPFDVMIGGFDQILFRPTAEVSEDAKVTLVGRLAALGTPDAYRFLRDVRKRWPANGSVRVKQAIEKAMANGSSGAPTGGGAP